MKWVKLLWKILRDQHGAVYYGKKGELRLYDAGSPKKYVVVTYSLLNISVPEGAPRPVDTIVLNRAQLDSAAGYIQGPDDVIVAPSRLSLSFKLDDGQPDLLHEFIGLRFASGQQITWVAGIGATPLVTTKGTSVGRPDGLFGVFHVLPQFQDPMKKCVDVETLWSQLAGNMGRRITEVYFPPSEQTLTESIEAVTVGMVGEVYGNTTSMVAFSAGTKLVAS